MLQATSAEAQSSARPDTPMAHGKSPTRGDSSAATASANSASHIDSDERARFGSRIADDVPIFATSAPHPARVSAWLMKVGEGGKLTATSTGTATAPNAITAHPGRSSGIRNSRLGADAPRPAHPAQPPQSPNQPSGGSAA